MSSGGFVILSQIIQRYCLHLGGIRIDLYSYVDQLTHAKGDSLISFYQSAISITTKIQLQVDEIGLESRLVWRFIETLYKTLRYFHILREDFRAINQFFR